MGWIWLAETLDPVHRHGASLVFVGGGALAANTFPVPLWKEVPAVGLWQAHCGKLHTDTGANVCVWKGGGASVTIHGDRHKCMLPSFTQRGALLDSKGAVKRNGEVSR